MMNLQGAKSGLVTLLVIVLLCLSSGQLALAQVSASITGKVEDPSGAAIPAANVTVTSLETGAVRTMETDSEGNYRLLSLAVGRYEVRAQKQGFKAIVQTGIELAVAQVAVVNLRLEVGAIQEQVTVTGDAALVNTTTSSIAGLVGERQVKELPINGRSFDLLITLNPGAINYSAMKNSNTVLTGGNLFSVAGRCPSQNLTLLNGVEYTGAGNAGITPGGASGQLLGIDAVREYNVVTDTYGAEYGQRAGAQVSVVTQSGTNQLHGALFEFLRNSAMDARNFFDQERVPPFKRNQFGGALGGPIRKDKTFVFGNYEGFRQHLAVSNVTFVPDANARKGLLPCVAGGVPACGTGVPVGTPTQVPSLDTRMLPLLDYWAAPNGAVLGGGIAVNISNPLQQIRQDFGTVRVDQVLSDKDNLSAAYTIDDGINISPGAGNVFGTNVIIRNQLASLQETHVFSPRVINIATMGFSRGYFNTQNSPIATFPDSLSFIKGEPGGTGGLNLGSAGNSSAAVIPAAGARGPYRRFIRNLFTYSDNVQIVNGKHQFSAGAWLQRIRANDADPLNGSGIATFTNLATMLQGITSAFQVSPAIVQQGWRTWNGAWFVQDSIQLRPNLTLRLGLRHEFSSGWSESTGRAQTVLFDQSGVIITAPRISSRFNTVNNSKWLFSPRIGLAWDPFGKGKTSVRASYGTYYDLVDTLSYLVDGTAPLNGIANYNNVSLFSVIPVDRSAVVPPACGPGVPNPCNTYSQKGVQSDYKVPTVQSWNLTIEQQLNRSMAFRVAYVGFRGYHQFFNRDPNSIGSQICSTPAGCVSGGVLAANTRGLVPQGAEYIPVGLRPNQYQTFGLFLFSDSNQSYNSLQMDLIKRLTSGLQFRVNYTWAKNLDISSGIISTIAGNQAQVVMNRNNLRQDWGPSAQNQTHQSSMNFSYQLPFGQGKAWLNGAHGVMDKLVGGWQVNGIVTLLSGFPFTPLIGANRSGNGDSSNPDRPSLNPAFTGPIITGSPNKWYDPNAFILPTAGTFGNLGRGRLKSPGLAALDFSVFKNTRISERVGLQFRAEAFNILNHTNLGYPTQQVFLTGAAISPTAGIITRTTTTSRQIQFGLKLIF